MNLPVTQVSIEITHSGDPDVLQACQRQIPVPNDKQILIEVAAAGVNRPDVFQRLGFYPPPPSVTDIPGLEVSGTVVAIGSAVTRWALGDEVCALLSGGGYSQYVIAEEALCLSIPKGLSLIDAAALPETCFTVWHNLFERAELKAGECLLVHGGASGIGTTAIQIATALGIKVIATAGSDKKCAMCESLGAVKAINYNDDDFVSESLRITGSGVDVILDMVGGDYVQKNFSACAPKARIVSIAFLRGSKVEVDLMPLMLKQLVITGSTLRSQPLENKARIAKGVENNVWPLIEEQLFKPITDTTFALTEASDAHKLMESNKHIGKILLVANSTKG
jgi:NADPH2:quinone reductase